MKLVYKEGKTITRKDGSLVRTGNGNTEVKRGDIVQSFRGGWFRVHEILKPSHPNSTGRMVVSDTDEKGSYTGANFMTFFPSVFDAYWVRP